MAKLEKVLSCDLQTALETIESAVMNSVSASLEDASDIVFEGGRCAVRVYERYSAFGSNRVSLNITALESGGKVYLCAITSGGSQAMFFKVNTLGEESFLDSITGAVESLT